MPNVTGQEVREAKVIIRAALPGAHVIVQQASSADLPGEVFAQFPAAGSRIPPGAPITLVVSAGPR
jgi:beta-lactam-binding protein with PASTA domain